MTRSIAFAGVMFLSIVAAGPVAAQEEAGPGKFEITLIPAGATFFTHHDSGPSFGSYDVGATGGYNFTRVVGVEGEVGGSLGVKQHISGLPEKVDTPNMLSYTGNVVVGKPIHSVLPYVTGGGGGLTVYDSRDLGIDDKIGTFWTYNVGGGIKWYQASRRWGLRGDYRFQVVQSKDDAPAFFGEHNRYSNRIYGGVILNVVK